MQRLDKDKIRDSLSEEDIKLILRDLGSAEPKEITGKNELHFSTVCHGGHKHKLYYYPDSHSFRCYTDCQETMDIYEVVMKARRNTFYESVRYIANLTGKHFTSSDSNKIQSHIVNDWEIINKYKRKEKINAELPVIDEKIMQVFLPYPHEEWLKEISYETLQKFETGFYIREDRITLPHRDIDNRLIGIRGRAMREEDVVAGKKYMPVTVENRLLSHATMFNLFGLNVTKNAIHRLKKAMIYEDEKSVMKCQDFYQDNNFSVATGGSALSDYQVNLLLSQGIEEVFIARDKEFEDHESEKAYDYAERLLKQAYKFTPYVRTYILFDKWNLLELKDSPADKGKFVLEELMRRKFEINTKDEYQLFN